MKIITSFLAAGAVVASVGSAQAVPISYDATSFSSSEHSIYLFDDFAGVGRKFDFSPAGVFDTDQKFWGTLTGSAFAKDGVNGWDVDFSYDGETGSRTGFKDGGGPAGNPDNFFLNMIGGTLTGFGGVLSGIVLDVTRAPANGKYATQVGTGANDKNGEFGMSNWFTIACSAGCGAFQINDARGDVNLNLTETNRAPVPPVPLPAAGWLLIAGLGGLAAMKRRKDV